jgi:protein ImuB
LDRIERDFARLGLEIRLALTESPGSSWAWSRFRPAGSPAIMENGRAGAALGPLPVEALRLPALMVGTLNRLGLRTVAALARLPRPALAARFGEDLLRRLDQALGTALEPIAPRRPPAVYAAEQEFAEPLMVPEALGAVLKRLLPPLCRQLEASGLGARRLAYTIYRIDGSMASAMIGTSRAVRDPTHLAKLFAPRLETLDPDPGIEALRLEAVETAPFMAGQTALTVEAADPVRGQSDLAALIDTLANRLGADHVGYLAPQPLHLPERQTHFVSALAAAAPDWSSWPETSAPAPLRLLASPEGVEIEEPPAEAETPPRAFLWRRRLHRTVRVTGPDRRLGAWWQGDDTGRDYWAVEDEAGRRLWLCRDLATGRWAVHGVLAPAA